MLPPLVWGWNMTPKRIQRKRESGWRLPPDAVVVTRPTKYGNKYRVDRRRDGHYYIVNTEIVGTPHQQGGIMHVRDAHARAVMRFRSDLMQRPFEEVYRMVQELKGKDLACWCGLCDRHQDGLPLGVSCDECIPCHADVWLEIANE